MSEYIFSVKKRKGYARRDMTVYEVMVRIPDYKDYPVSVGGREQFTFDNETDATADCMERIAEKLSQGHDASYEVFDYEQWRKDNAI